METDIQMILDIIAKEASKGHHEIALDGLTMQEQLHLELSGFIVSYPQPFRRNVIVKRVA